jgi:starch synthase (maltosyl-transferring)
MTPTPFSRESACPRIYYAYLQPDHAIASHAGMRGMDAWERVCAQARSLGFDGLMIPPLWSTAADRSHGAPDDPDAADPQWLDTGSMIEALTAAARISARHTLRLFMDLVLDRVVADGALAREKPDWYESPDSRALDPRDDMQTGLARLRSFQGRAPAGFIDAWGERLLQWSNAGVAGFRCRSPAGITGADWGELMARVREQRPECRFLAWTPGLTPQQLEPLAAAHFDASFLSLPWWDYRAPWLMEEHERLQAVSPVIVLIGDPDSAAPNGQVASRSLSAREAGRRLWSAAFIGQGLLMPMGVEQSVDPRTIQAVNQWIGRQGQGDTGLARLSGPLSDVTAFYRTGATATLLLINPDDHAPAPIDWPGLRARLPDTDILDGGGELPTALPAGEYRLVVAVPADSIVIESSPGDLAKDLARAARGARIAIENISPVIDAGRFAVKRTLGDTVAVQADVFMDGHDALDVILSWRAADETTWRSLPMQPLGNDRWHAGFAPERLGRHYYRIQAWRGGWRSYSDALRKKTVAGQDVSLEVEEGRILLAAALRQARRIAAPAAAAAIAAALDEIGLPQRPAPRGKSAKAGSAQAAGNRRVSEPPAHPSLAPANGRQVEVLLSEAVSDALELIGQRPFLAASGEYPLAVERRRARFASWYELFPRSQSSRPGVHGTFSDVIERLPAIRGMGFDVVYFPPIHPIGLRNRKGRNNALQADPGDPGSPYAIGAAEGGHDAVHPQLGSLEDFRALLGAAQRQGLEIAMDFAIQCSPDHPWLADHPEWFDWRADGSLRYAENPPKRYEDIVNPDFYGAGPSAAQTALWQALRDVVLFWTAQGVRIFRVDNPHTKPLPFWEWLISDVQGRHPDTLFLSEAFTRPKPMYRLAKLGFTQSYTYFTWRNGKQEIADYLTELDSAPIADFFRPHFFVNTPDINPRYLQQGGRAGFLVRAALAATTSGLWGMYSGFELCEAQALAGKEEYQDSEKYQLRQRDWNLPGNIVAEITRLNHIRRLNPALQSHRGIRFHGVDNDRILFFSKATPQQDNIVIVAINLDPHAAQAGTLELPLWQWDLPDDAVVPMQDLFNGGHFSLQGKYHHVELTPDRPFLLWGRT